MKKYLLNSLLALLVSVVFVPHIAFAAWWNPFTWFSNWGAVQPKTSQIEVAKVPDKVATTTSSTSLPVPVPRVVSSSVKTPSSQTKKAVVKEQSVSSPQEVQKWLGILDAAIASYQKSADTFKANTDFVISVQNEWLSRLDTDSANLLFAATLLEKTSNQKLIDDINSKIAELQTARKSIATTNYVNGKIWNDAKVLEMQTSSANIVSEGNAVVQEYKDSTDLIRQRLQLINSQYQTQPSPQYTPPAQSTASIQFAQLCNNTEDDIRKEVSSGGGMATEAQIQALAYQRKQKLGCYNGTIPTAICSDFTPSYSTNRSGTCSDHGGVMFWY